MKLIRRVTTLFFLLAVSLLFAACSSDRSAVSSVAYEPSMAAIAEDRAAEREYISRTLQPQADRKIVSTVGLTLVVDDTDAALAALNTLIGDIGGYVAQTNLYQSSQNAEQLEGTITVRVPSPSLDRALEQITALAVRVEAQNMNRQDVTEQYVDLHARLRNLEATEVELRALLSEVRTRPDAEAADILAVHQSLTQIRSEIEQLQGQINLLDDMVALSTINIFLRLDTAALPIVEEGWRPGATLTAALRALTSTMQELGNLAIWWAVYLLPITLILVVPISASFFVVRWFLQRRQWKRREGETM